MPVCLFLYIFVCKIEKSAISNFTLFVSLRLYSRMTLEEFEHIAPSLRDTMQSVGRSFFGNEADADDVAQEGLVALWKYSDRMAAGSDHTCLATRIAKHCCMDIVRKRKTEIVVPEGFGGTAQPRQTARSPQEIMESKELNEVVSRAIDKLKPSERHLYELRQIEGRLSTT